MQPVARRLGILLADCVLSAPALPADLVVVPVPLFGAKQRRRGFNQSELLAASAVQAIRRRRPGMQVTQAPCALQRQRATESQTGLSPHQRRANVRGAFLVAQPAWVAERNILLVDDIYTTGATARACSLALRKAGAAAVWVATVARAQREFPWQPAQGRERAPMGDSGASPELPMEEDFVFWEEGRAVQSGGGTS